MSCFVFFAVPLFGHVNYGLKIAKRLAENGHEVYYFSGNKYKNMVEQKGVVHCSYDTEIEEAFAVENSTYDVSNVNNVDYEKIDYIDELWRLGWHLFSITDCIRKKCLVYFRNINPDAIVYDSIAIWGKWLAWQLQIPAITSCTPYYYSREMISKEPAFFSKAVLRQKDSINLDINHVFKVMNKRLWIEYPELKNLDITTSYAGSGDTNIIFSSEQLQRNIDLIKKENNHFVGIMIDEGDTAHDVSYFISQGKPNIYIALGTIHNDAMVYQACVDALREFDFNVVMSVGKANQANRLLQIPTSWRVENSVPQIALLKKIDVFISHGGVNSVREASHFGVPIVIIPKAGDHYIIAEDIRRKNTGIVINNYKDTDEIRRAVLKCLQNQSIKHACKKMAEEMQSLGGLERVVEIIEAKLN